jgi:DNA-binding MarR family transcriptional regulator
MPERATRTRRSPTAHELAVWRDFIETTEVLRAQLAARMQRESGLSTGDYAVLLALSEADDTCLRSSWLARTIGWERSRLSHHLARMQQRGLIERRDTEGDNRGTEVALTRAGSDAFRRASAPHLRLVRELFIDAFDAEQLDRVAELTEALRTHLGPEACDPEDAGTDEC